MSPTFLTLEDVLELHHESIRRYGGAVEVRDMGLLQSALAMPAASFRGQYLHDTLVAMAGAYLFHIVQNHPFVDGNKRTGAAAARVFLLLNNVRFDPPADEFEQIVIDVASGKADKTAATVFFQKYSQTRIDEN